jgi:hypothetical protein
MPIPTCAVRVIVSNVDGAAAVNALVRARLDTPELYESVVIDGWIETYTDENGEASLQLFPNDLGSNASSYLVTIDARGVAARIYRIVVPEAVSADFWTLVDLYPGQTVATSLGGILAEAGVAKKSSDFDPAGPLQSTDKIVIARGSNNYVTTIDGIGSVVGGGGTGGPVEVNDITDSGAAGRALLVAEAASTARSVLGLGTSAIVDATVFADAAATTTALAAKADATATTTALAAKADAAATTTALAGKLSASNPVYTGTIEGSGAQISAGVALSGTVINRTGGNQYYAASGNATLTFGAGTPVNGTKIVLTIIASANSTITIAGLVDDITGASVPSFAVAATKRRTVLLDYDTTVSAYRISGHTDASFDIAGLTEETLVANIIAGTGTIPIDFTGTAKKARMDLLAAGFGTVATVNAAAVAADMKYADALSIVMDGVIRRVSLVELKDFVRGFPWGIDRTGVVDATTSHQRKHDALLNFSSGHKDPTFVTGATYTLQASDANKVVYCYATATTITVPTAFNGLQCTIVAAGMFPSTVTQPATVITIAAGAGATVGGTLTATHSYRPLKLTNTGTNTWTSAAALIAGGDSTYLASGFYKHGPMACHPSNSIHGSNLGTTQLTAPANAAPVEADLAMFYLLARTGAEDAQSASLPERSGFSCFGNKNNQTNTLHGERLIVGNTDPDWISSDTYKGSAAKYTAVGYYQFNGSGVYSQADRQRFDSHFLRAVGNGLTGLSILGNDSDVGQRTGLGSNSGHQLRIAGPSGGLLHGTNMFSGGGSRADSCLAMMATGLNGHSCSGIVANDTIALESSNKPADQSLNYSTFYCGPNKSALTADGVPAGTAGVQYNTYVRVQGCRNIDIVNFTMCPTAEGRTFLDHVRADADTNGGANVNYRGTITTRPDSFGEHFKNFSSTAQLPVLADATSVISFDIADVYTGARYIGRAGVSATAGLVLGGDPAVAAIPGYSVQIGGPVIQTVGIRRVESTNTAVEAQQFTSDGQNRNINGNTDRAFLQCNANYAANSITLQATGSDYYECDIEINGTGSIGALTWVLPGGGHSWATGHVPPSYFRGPRMTISVARRVNNNWFILAVNTPERQIMTQANFAAIASPYEGQRVYTIDVGPSGLDRIYLNSQWRPLGRQTIVAAFDVVGVASAADQILYSTLLPAGILSGQTIEVTVSRSNNGTTDAEDTFRVMLNTANSLTTPAPAVFMDVSGLTGANNSQGLAPRRYRVTSSTNLRKLGTAGLGTPSYGDTSNSAATTDVTIPAASGALYLIVSVDMAGATDIPTLRSLFVDLLPS